MDQNLPDVLTTKDILLYIGLPIAGAFATHLWTRFRRRLTTLRWTTQYQPLAFATEDLGWGRVDILYNNQPTRNLYVITVRIINDSQNDLSNLELDLQVNEGTAILRSAPQIRNAITVRPFRQNIPLPFKDGVPVNLHLPR